MNKKAFTLIELLGVLVLLTIISIILIPNISKTLKEGRIKTDKQAEENIVLAARSWVSEHRNSVPENGTYKVTLDELKKGGYIDSTIKRPSTGEDITTACVNISMTKATNGNKKYSYKYNENCS